MEIRKMPTNNDENILFIHSMFEDVLREKGIDGTFNYVEISGNSILPKTGYTKHAYDEFSLVLEGEIEADIDGKIYPVKAGDYTLIKKNIPHRTLNNKNKTCKIISLLI